MAMDLLTIPTQPVLDYPLYGNAEAPPPSSEYFAENFWGEKNTGFNILYHNMKHGQISVKDLQDFIRESANAEELYAKHMTKLAKQAANCNPIGTFSPLMEVLKVMTEKISSCHMDIVLKLQDIIKDLGKYLDDQKAKHKHSKENFSGTVEALHNIQVATTAVTKSREKYNQVCMEEVRLKAAGNAQQKELEKVSSKIKKAADEYRNLVGKHAIARHKFEEKMYQTAQEFQKIEKEHLLHMQSVLDTYILSFENAHVLVNQVHQEFRRQVDESTVDRLLQQYAEQKGTGMDRPTTILFEEFKPENVPSVVENGTQNHSLSDIYQTIPPPPAPTKTKKETSGGLFGIRRKKTKQKNDVSTNSSSSKDSKDAESIESPEKEPEYQIDEEGYTIRPASPAPSDKNSFRFSSDSDSDSDSDDATRKKIQIRIKPKEATTTDSGGSDLETLNAITRNLTLGSPSPLAGPKKLTTAEPKKSKTASSSNLSANNEKLSTDELLQLFANSGTSAQSKVTRTSSTGKVHQNEELDLFSLQGVKSAKTWKEREKTSIKKGPAPPIPVSVPHSNSTKSLDEILTMSDNTSDINPDIPPPRPPKPGGSAVVQDRPNNLTIGSAKAENHETTRSYSAPLASSESWSSLSSAGGTGTPTYPIAENPVPGFASISRGPSPLTLSHTDNIPIAVAFIETVNAYFKGNDESKTLTKTTGDMQISFPAGITRAFTSNPNPAVLSFNIKSPSSKLFSNVSHNKTLLRRENLNSEGSCSFSFDMPSLVAHIRNLTEKDPNSPHYNIHILSYVVPSSHQTLPLHFSSTWQCGETTTSIKVDYSYNAAAASTVLQSLNVIVPVQGTVTDVQSVPKSTWNSAQNRLCWQLPGKVSPERPSGSLQSTLTMSSGPSEPSTLAVQFLSEGSTLSGADFELSGTGYRVSLIKKRFLTGKYLCENL